MKNSERGSVTLWMLGLSLLLLLFGGVALDFWRALALQRNLASIADSAAIAAASGIDEDFYRLTGEVVVDETRASDFAEALIDTQNTNLQSFAVIVDSDGTQVTVDVVGQVELGLLGIFVDQSEPLQVRGSATASPRFVP